MSSILFCTNKILAPHARTPTAIIAGIEAATACKLGYVDMCLCTQGSLKIFGKLAKIYGGEIVYNESKGLLILDILADEICVYI